VREAWCAELDLARGGHPALDAAIARIKAELADVGDAEYRARQLADQLALTMQASLLVRAGNDAVAQAFIASRLGTGHERTWGTLPRGVDLHRLIERGDPAAT
jgi:putative acyl-CoA dehydrogenase